MMPRANKNYRLYIYSTHFLPWIISSEAILVGAALPFGQMAAIRVRRGKHDSITI